MSTPDEAWAALETLHGLPLTLYDADRAWQVHEGETTTLIYVDRFAPDLIVLLEGLNARRAAVFVYAWAPGQVRDALTDALGRPADIEIHRVREALVRRYRQ